MRRSPGFSGLKADAAVVASIGILWALACPGASAPGAEWKTEKLTPPGDPPAATTAPAVAGPVWYRCFIRAPANMVTPAEKDLWRDSVTLSLAGVVGPFQVYLNGRQIGAGEAVPDDARRRFKVPKDVLEKGAFNVLAIRVEGKAGGGGGGPQMRRPPILAGYFDELLLDGEWEVLRGEIAPTDAALKPARETPARAAYTEAGFRQSSTPLNPNPETMPGQRLAPAASHARMRPADDLAIDLMLHEPLVAQPTHVSFDERGRMWVSQYRQYPYPAGVKMISRDKYYRSRFDRVPPPPPHHDKGNDVISVHEDADGDGRFDKHKVVLDGLNMANAAVRGHGGVWVMHTPYLMFYPDADADDVPDRDPEVRLAGFGLEDTHSVANGLTWGPDGWLYGGQGSTTTSRITRPGVDAPNAPGVFFEGCMVWRYHPQTKAYEIFAEGGGNTFGLDFDAEGRLFSGHNGGETRGWHFVQSGLFLKQGVDPGKFGPPANSHAFGELQMMRTRNPIPRFTHGIVVFEGTALPERYAGRIIGADPLHRNLTVSERYPRGSTFETSDSGVALTGEDIAFRPVFLTNAPDGGLYVADFYEEFIAHGQNYQGQIDPTTGRIYRLRGRSATLNGDVDLSRKTAKELVRTLSHPNRWHRQTAVRLLGERRDTGAVPALKGLVARPQAHPALEALWALHQAGALDEATALEAMAHPAGPVRAWAVRLVGDARSLPERVQARAQALAEADVDPEVRAQVASTARRLPSSQALPLVAALLRRDADASDPYIPLLCWWAIEPHCDADREAVLALLRDAAAWDDAPMREYILPRLMRRFAAAGTRANFLTCARLIEMAPRDAHRKQLMSGFEAAFKGRPLPPLPAELAGALAKSGQVSPVLRVRLGDPEAIRASLALAGDPKGRADDRLTSIALFGEVKAPQAVPVLLAIAKGDGDASAVLRRAALASLMLYEQESVGTEVVGLYAALPADVRPAAVNLLAGRAAWSIGLLKLVEAGTVRPADVPADVTARLQTHPDERVATLARKLLGAPRSPDKAERLAESHRVRQVIAQSPGDPYKGEPIFMQRCGACHALFHKGGNVGPNLTAYQRDDIGTMLPSILDPNAEVREGYVNYVVTTKDGRTISGFLTDSDATVVALRGFDGQDVRISRADVVDLKPAGTSVMPEGLLGGLDDQSLRDLFAYLRIPQPITQ